MKCEIPRVLQDGFITALFLGAFSLCTASIAPTALCSNQKGTQSPPVQQKTFNTPTQAVNAVVVAAERDDVPALIEILGPGSEDILSTADKVADNNARETFVQKARENKRIVPDPSNPKRKILDIGADSWPFPIPLVQQGGKWRFDAKAGKEEILARRIGSNELNAINVCEGYVEAQKEYASQIRDGKDPNQYAQKLISTPGKHDGLYWKNPDGSSGGPIGELVAEALASGYATNGKPFHGYYFKILKGQGPAAPMGRLDYVINGAMIGGFALVAAPAEYRVTGVKTFIVSQDGTVYQKDLGPETLAGFRNMELYNPDKTWKQVSAEYTAALSTMAGR